MREIHRRQFQLGQVPIDKIRIDPKSRDDIPAVLKGLQHIWCDEGLRARLLALLDEHVLPEVDRTVGRPGMELWRILVLGVLKQGLNCDLRSPLKVNAESGEGERLSERSDGVGSGSSCRDHVGSSRFYS